MATKFENFPLYSTSRREYYNSFFSNNVVSFIHIRLDKYFTYDDKSHVLQSGLIQFFTKVLEMDFIYWFKHRKTKKCLPLISAFKTNVCNSDEKTDIDELIEQYLYNSKNDFELISVLLKLIAMISTYASLTTDLSKSLKKKKSIKHDLATSLGELYEIFDRKRSLVKY